METDSKITDFRDASFSAYLNTPKANLIVKLTDSVQFPHPAIISSQEISKPTGLERSKTEEGEIDIFGAEKYFGIPLGYVNEDDEIPGSTSTYPGKYVHEKKPQIDFDRSRLRTKGKIGTPSTTSGTSYNSQTALLSSSLRNSSNQIRQKKVNERWFLSVFSCKGSCSDKESVNIDQNIARGGLQGKGSIRKEASILNNTIRLEGGRKHSLPRFQAKEFEFLQSPSPQNTNIGSTREGYFLLPTVNSGVRNLAVRRDQVQKAKEEEARPSLEVFGSHTIKKEDIAMNLERRLSVLTWDAFPKAPNVRTTSTSRHLCDEIESDASSDLFEIENISAGSVQPIILAKQASDGMSSCMSPTSQYEPSEASIEWSVVTASAADFSSAVTDYDEKKMFENSKNPLPSSMTKSKGRSNGILGCKSHKAVEVAETAYKRNDKAKSHLQQPLP